MRLHATDSESRRTRTNTDQLTFGDGRDEKEVEQGGGVAVTHDGDVVGVAAERVDVLADVVQRGDEVEQRVVAGRRVIRQAQETCSTRPPLTHSLTHTIRAPHRCMMNDPYHVNRLTSLCRASYLGSQR